MLWKLLQVYWLVLILDLRCMAIGDTSTIKLKTENNGKIDPFSFEVYPTSQGGTFDKFSDDFNTENEESDLFFKDINFFEDDGDDTFYQSPFGRSNTTMQDYFSKSIEESRSRYMEDVNNIDKMFKTPVKSSIDELLRGETTRGEATSKNLNTSERTSVFNENIERDVRHTTKRSVDSSNNQIPSTHSLNSNNPQNVNNSLFSDVHKAAATNAVTKLTSMTEKDAKDVVDNEEDKDKNRETRGSGNDKGLLDSQKLKLENAFLESTNVVTEISVQETVDGKIVQRKPSSDELRLIKSKILSSSPRNASKQEAATVTLEYDDLDPNGETVKNLTKSQDEEIEAQGINLPNELIDDLSSFLKVDPNFADDEMDEPIIDDGDIKDMDSILSEKDGAYNNSNDGTIKEEMNKNIQIDGEKQSKENDLNGSEDPKSKLPATSGDGDDPRKYRKIFHTEHKNLSNVSDVKIMFSETEGDFLDDDDDDSEYSLNVSEKPEVGKENTTKKIGKSLDRQDNVKQYSVQSPSPITTTKGPDLISKNKDNQNTQNQDTNSDEVSTILNKVVFSAEPLSPTESVKYANRYGESHQHSTISVEQVDVTDSTELPLHTTGNNLVTENLPSFTEREVLDDGNLKEETTTFKELPQTNRVLYEPEKGSSNNFNLMDKVSVSSQNINDTIYPEGSVTEFYEDFEDPIPEISDISFTTTEAIEEMDDIDRTMALIKQILAESKTSEEKTDVSTLQKQENSTNSDNVSSIEETVTIPLDVSTIRIDITTTEELVQTLNGLKDVDITTEFSTKDLGLSLESNKYIVRTKVGILDSTESSFTTTADMLGTEISNSATDVNSIASVTSTTVGNSGETKSTVNPVGFKETEVEPHEISSSEVESLYNSKLEEYDSLEETADVSEENARGWTIFGNKNKEVNDKVNKGKDQKENGNTNDKESGSKYGSETFKETINVTTSDKHIVNDNPKEEMVPLLQGIILNNTAEFSVKICKQDETFYVPSSAYIQQYPNTVNITWRTNEYLNNSIAMQIFEKENFYMIKEIMINLLTGNEFIKQRKPVAFKPDPDLDDSLSGKNRVVMMKDGTYIFFSNIDFLKKDHGRLEYSEASMRERRLWHIEIAFICLTVIAVIVIVLYFVAVKTKRKITLREKNELAQVTHC